MVGFSKIRHFLPIDILICLYNSPLLQYLSPLLQYGILILGLTYETYTRPVFLLRKKTFENFTSPSTVIFHNLKILKLYDLFQLKLLNFVYESFNKTSPTSFHYFFNLVEPVHQHRTQQATRNDIFLTHKNTLEYGLRSVRYSGAVLE